MKAERKQIAVKVLAESHAKLLAIQEETGLSQAKVLEMLLANYEKPLVLAKPLAFDDEKVLAKLQAQVQVLVKEQVKIEVAKLKELLAPTDEDWEDDEPMIDESPFIPVEEPVVIESLYSDEPVNPLDLIAELDEEDKKPKKEIDPLDFF
jgi:hypothetical protein